MRGLLEGSDAPEDMQPRASAPPVRQHPYVVAPCNAVEEASSPGGYGVCSTRVRDYAGAPIATAALLPPIGAPPVSPPARDATRANAAGAPSTLGAEPYGAEAELEPRQRRPLSDSIDLSGMALDGAISQVPITLS